MSPKSLQGRRRELGEVEHFLDRVPSGLSALALTGPAGIGKTSVWREGVRRAALRGYLVLSARPGQGERSLSFAGLADLLGPVPEEAFGALAAVQRHALDVALLRAEADPRPQAGAIPAALLSLLRHVAAAGPVLIAVDDAQWLDDATAENLSFALRRLERLLVGVLVTVQVEGEQPPAFDASVPGERRRETLLGPLSIATLHDILKGQLGRSLPRPTLVRIAGSCGGNPFYALEIGRELERVEVPPPGEPLPVPGELQALVRSRMTRLAKRTRQALLMAACLSQPTGGLVDLDAIAPAEKAGIIRAERDGRLRFGHPLLASAVQESATASARRAMHRKLAGLIDDPEERARHLAAVATGPDETVAAALDAAAARAAGRGALTAATALARRAIEFTADPASEQAMRRAVTFAEHCVPGGGDPAEARAALESALARCGKGDLRAELLLRIAWAAREQGRPEEAYPGLLEALAETTDRALTARIHLQATWMSEADPAHGRKHCDAALELLDETTDPGTYSSLLLHRAYLRLISGQGADDASIERGKAIEDRAVAAGLTYRSPVPAIWPLLKDEFTRAAAVHAEQLEWSRQAGQQPLEQSLAWFLSLIELYRGNWERARYWADSLAEMVEQSGSNLYWFNHLMAAGMVDAHTGRLDRAGDAGAQALKIAATSGNTDRQATARALLGFIALSRCDPACAAEHLSAADSLVEGLGQREPAVFRFHPDLIEALIGTGDLAHAQAQVDRLAARARVFPRPWTLAMEARGRGLVLATKGDLDGASAALREALAHHERLEMPFERGRTLLAYGQVLRRGNERQARAALSEALAVFEALGAVAWARRAREELKRVPVRRGQAGLTVTEEQIARLAVAGLSNREIAERAFVSTKTVEANLSRAYSKLGVRSRAQLARVLAPPETPAGPLPRRLGSVGRPGGTHTQG